MLVVHEGLVWCAATLVLLAGWAARGAAARRQAPAVSYEEPQYDDAPAPDRTATPTYYDDETIKIEKNIAKDDDDDPWQGSGLNYERRPFDGDVDDIRKERKNKIKVDKHELRHKSKEPSKKLRSKEKSSLDVEDRGRKRPSKKHLAHDLENEDEDLYLDSKNKKKNRKSDKKKSKKHSHKYKSLHDLDDLNQLPIFDDQVVTKSSRRDKVKELESREVEDGLDVKEIYDPDISETRNREHKARKRLSEKEDSLDVTLSELAEYRRTPRNVEISTTNRTEASISLPRSNSRSTGEGVALDLVKKVLEGNTVMSPMPELNIRESLSAAMTTPLLRNVGDTIAGILDWRIPAINPAAIQKKPPKSRVQNQQRNNLYIMNFSDASPSEVAIRPRPRNTNNPINVDAKKYEVQPRTKLRDRARRIIRERYLEGNLDNQLTDGGDGNPVVCDLIDESLLAAAPSVHCRHLTTAFVVMVCLLSS